jgi:hypothetical protein
MARVLYRDDHVTVTACQGKDRDADPSVTANFTDPYSAEAEQRLGKTWSYVSMIVTVTLHGAPIAERARFGIEHGHLDATTDRDAWDRSPADYRPEDDTIILGSPLTETILEALTATEEWLTTIGNNAAMLRAVWAWADPNAVREVDTTITADWVLCGELGHWEDDGTPFRCTDERGHEGEHNQ